MKPNLKIVGTRGFLRLEVGAPLVVPFAHRLAQRPRGEPSWIIADPEAESQTFEDDGRTLRVPAPARFWVIRDDHEGGCACGCGANSVGASVVTFLLPDEY